MYRWQALAVATTTVVGAAALGAAVGLNGSTDQELELVAADSAGQYTFMVRATGVDDLYPGAVRRLRLTLTNPYPYDLRVTAVHAELVSTSRPGCAPTPVNLQVQPYTGAIPVRVAAKDSEEAGVVPVHMPNSVANDCQRATFSIVLHADAVRPDPTRPGAAGPGE